MRHGEQSIRWNGDKNFIEMIMRHLLGYSYKLYTDFEDQLADNELWHEFDHEVNYPSSLYGMLVECTNTVDLVRYSLHVKS